MTFEFDMSLQGSVHLQNRLLWGCYKDSIRVVYVITRVIQWISKTSKKIYTGSVKDFYRF